MTTLRVEVTAGDIATGIPGCSWKCALALAFTRALGQPGWVSPLQLSDWRCWVATDRIVLPAEMVRFAEDYDAGRTVQPRVFEVEV